MNTKEVWAERFGKLVFVAEGIDSTVYRYKDGREERVLRIYKNQDLTLGQINLYKDTTNQAAVWLRDKPEKIGSLSVTILPIIEVVETSGQIATVSEYVAGKNLQDIKGSTEGHDLRIKEAMLSLGLGDREILINLETLGKRISDGLGCIGLNLDLVNVKPLLKEGKLAGLVITDLCGSIGSLGLPEIQSRR